MNYSLSDIFKLLCFLMMSDFSTTHLLKLGKQVLSCIIRPHHFNSVVQDAMNSPFDLSHFLVPRPFDLLERLYLVDLCLYNFAYNLDLSESISLLFHLYLLAY